MPFARGLARAAFGMLHGALLLQRTAQTPRH